MRKSNSRPYDGRLAEQETIENIPYFAFENVHTTGFQDTPEVRYKSLGESIGKIFREYGEESPDCFVYVRLPRNKSLEIEFKLKNASMTGIAEIEMFGAKNLDDNGSIRCFLQKNRYIAPVQRFMNQCYGAYYTRYSVSEGIEGVKEALKKIVMMELEEAELIRNTFGEETADWQEQSAELMEKSLKNMDALMDAIKDAHTKAQIKLNKLSETAENFKEQEAKLSVNVKKENRAAFMAALMGYCNEAIAETQALMGSLPEALALVKGFKKYIDNVMKQEGTWEFAAVKENMKALEEALMKMYGKMLPKALAETKALKEAGEGKEAADKLREYGADALCEDGEITHLVPDRSAIGHFISSERGAITSLSDAETERRIPPIFRLSLGFRVRSMGGEEYWQRADLVLQQMWLKEYLKKGDTVYTPDPHIICRIQSLTLKTLNDDEFTVDYEE